MAVTGMTFTMYPVTDMPRAVTFYRDVLGLEKSGLESDYWVEFDVDGATFGIGNFEQVGVAGTAQSFALEIDDLAAFRSALAEHGYTTPEPTELQICSIAHVKDPDGNTVWLHQRKAT